MPVGSPSASMDAGVLSMLRLVKTRQMRVVDSAIAKVALWHRRTQLPRSPRAITA